MFGMRLSPKVLWLLVAVLVSALALTACEDNKRIVIDDDDDDPEATCPGQETPEAVLASLIDAYHDRDCDAYAKLLHSDFIFRFQDGDEPPNLGRDFWTFAEDSAGTCALLTSPHVSDIRLDLTYEDAAPATELDLVGTMKIRIHPTKVDVDDVDGTSWRVDGDVQDMFFIQGAEPDTSCWYLLEWRDIRGGGPGGGGNSGAGGEPGGGADGPGGANSARISWGTIKALY